MHYSRYFWNLGAERQYKIFSKQSFRVARWGAGLLITEGAGLGIEKIVGAGEQVLNYTLMATTYTGIIETGAVLFGAMTAYFSREWAVRANQVETGISQELARSVQGQEIGDNIAEDWEFFNKHGFDKPDDAA